MNIIQFSKQFIFGEDRPFASCHASTLAALPDNSILAAWFGGSREGAGDVAIWCSRRQDGKWSEPMKAADEEGLPHWNPVLHQDDAGRTWLFYKVGMKISSWQTRVVQSFDGGLTWSDPRELVKGDVGGRGPVKNKMIVLQNGVWAAPASLEGETWEAFVDRSDDGGASWTMSNRIRLNANAPSDGSCTAPAASMKGKGFIQPTLWESEPGRVHMLLRTTTGFIYRSDSDDGGKTWSEAYALSMPNNNSGIDLAKLPNGMLALVYNPVGENWGPRTPLVIDVSDDNGKIWRRKLTLEDGPGEYSYPAIIVSGNDILVTYTWKRENIAFWQIPIELLIS